MLNNSETGNLQHWQARLPHAPVHARVCVLTSLRYAESQRQRPTLHCSRLSLSFLSNLGHHSLHRPLWWCCHETEAIAQTQFRPQNKLPKSGCCSVGPLKSITMCGLLVGAPGRKTPLAIPDGLCWVVKLFPNIEVGCPPRAEILTAADRHVMENW